MNRFQRTNLSLWAQKRWRDGAVRKSTSRLGAGTKGKKEKTRERIAESLTLRE